MGRDHVEQLTDARPDFPPGLSDRMEDAWEPLLAIADLAGGEWPELARSAALSLHARKDPDQESPAIRLLTACREAMDGLDRITTHDLLMKLNADDTLPFDALTRGRDLTPRHLADILRRLGIRPTTIRLANGKTLKGYLREDFEQSWAEYLPQPPTRPSGMPSHRHTDSGGTVISFSRKKDDPGHRDVDPGRRPA